MRPQVGPALGRRRAPRSDQRRQFLPWSDPGHVDGDRSAREAGTVPPAPGGLRPRGLRRRGRTGHGTRPGGSRPCCSNRSRERAGWWSRGSDYLGAVRALCSERNALLMLDEVQTGLGRTGHWFAFQAQGLEPDVVTMAKALGNGMPVGACWARAEVAAAFGPGDHGSTFGGQPLALAAAKATLAVMEQEDVCRRARESGARLGTGLGELAGVVSVRARGCCSPPSWRRRSPRRSPHWPWSGGCSSTR